MRIVLFTLGLIGILISCNSETEYSMEEMVDAELVQYFDRFADEAATRGLEIDWNEEQISASILNIDDEAVGQCLTFSGDRRTINIDVDYWEKSSGLEKEFLIFHELGHCVLGRVHLDTSHSDGTCTSMMNSGESACRKNYRTSTRKVYLDELFS